MHAHTMQRGLAAAGLTAMMAVLAGCSLLGTPEPENTSAANDAAAAKFVACLTAEGQTAKILEDGIVGLLLPEGAMDDGPTFNDTETEGAASGLSGTTMVLKDDEGEWQASSSAEGYPEDGGMRDAWAACELEVPEFEQAEPDREGTATTSAEQMETALAFSECARENGYTDYPDPGENGEMNLPADITEDGFRALLEDCFDPDSVGGFMLTKETIDSLDFDLRTVMEDFFQDHPEFEGPGSGPQQSGESSGGK